MKLVGRLVAVMPTVAQLAGGAAATVGLYLLAGLGWALLAGGAVVAAVGTLAEMPPRRPKGGQ